VRHRFDVSFAASCRHHHAQDWDVGNFFSYGIRFWYYTGYTDRIMRNAERTITFRTNAEKIDALDWLALAQGRPRSYLINEANTNYIELHAYRDAFVRKGLEDFRQRRVVRCRGCKSAQEGWARTPRLLGLNRLPVTSTVKPRA
jgi:predicted transcriptional regulator